MGEGPTPLVQNLRGPDDFPGLVDYRGAKDGAGEKACFFVETGIEAQVGVGVLDVDGLGSGVNGAGNSQMVGEPDRLALVGVQQVC